jgi:flagellar basal-body rod protein FlgG
MLRGLYIGGLGMHTQFCALDIVSNNIANINTVGFKEDTLILKEFPTINVHRLNDQYIKLKQGYFDLRPKVGELGTGVGFHKVATIHRQGSLKHTNSVLDLAIQGEGFFVIRKDNEIYYTRAGNFSLSSDNYLITQQGYRLQSITNKDINLENAKNIKITEDGSIFIDISDEGNWKEYKLIDKLKIVTFEDLQGLIKRGMNLFQPTEYAGKEIIPTEYRILQGYLEESNVLPVKELTEMINIHRLYEINQRTVSVFDTLLNGLINQLPKL